MNKILELEALRGFAAIYVVFHHTLSVFFQSNAITSGIFKYGQEAVMIFFLLSGFVIAMSIDKKHYTFKEYFLHRFLRIYSVFLIAIAISGLIYFYLNPLSILDFKQLLLNLIMMQDHSGMKPGTFTDPIFNNNPLWSLSYEWWFYIIFFAHFALYRKNPQKHTQFLLIAFAISMTGVISYKIGYNQISLFLMYYYIWFSGAFVYFIFKTSENWKKHLLLLFTGYLLIIMTYGYLFIYHEKISHLVDHPVLELRHYLASMFFLIFAIVIYFKAHAKLESNSIYLKLRDFFAYFAPISFGLYVIHYPVKNLLLHYEMSGWLKLLLVFAISIPLSYVIEVMFFSFLKKKVFWKSRKNNNEVTE